MNNWIFRENNLDLIRLLAATQVAVLHSFEFMFAEKTGSLFFELLRLFPGVPIFFFISGLLISKSFESSHSLTKYAQNRALRIFPALIIVVFINIVMIWSTGYFNDVNPSFTDITLLFFAKITFFQFYNPDFIRGFGDGVLNGSLWTICVELQFYFLTPIIYLALNKYKKASNTILITLIILFIVLNQLLLFTADYYRSELVWKLFRVSFAPWFYMFLVGVLVQRNFAFISSLNTRVPFLPLLIAYTAAAYYASSRGIEFGNYVSPLIYFPLIFLVLNGAYYMPACSKKLLCGQDISYGIYIWHMPLVNQFLYYDLRYYEWQALLCIALTFVLAVCSWIFVEKPMIHLKKYTIK